MAHNAKTDPMLSIDSIYNRPDPKLRLQPNRDAAGLTRRLLHV